MDHKDFRGQPGALHTQVTMKYGLDVKIEKTFFQVWANGCDKLIPIEDGVNMVKQMPVNNIKEVKITYDDDTKSNPLFYNDDVKVRKYVDMTKKALEIQEQENVNLIQKVIQLKEEIALLQDLTDQKLSFSFCNQSTI